MTRLNSDIVKYITDAVKAYNSDTNCNIIDVCAGTGRVYKEVRIQLNE